MARGVFEVTLFGREHPDIVFVPDKLFPLGYPLFIVISSMCLQLPLASFFWQNLEN